MSELIDRLRTAYFRLGARDRLLLLVGGILLSLLLFLFAIWMPLDQRVERLRETVDRQLALRAWMAESAEEVRRLKASDPGQRVADQSLLAFTDRTAREAGLAGAMRRVEPEGNDRVRIVLEQAGFDAVTAWLEQLAGRFRVRIASITVERREEPGLVNVRVILQAPAQ
ncbi:MAG: type II secretion system protein M [Gammaproteobacteria bacterium]|jgi:general secretion pathway protein M|nr:type II secretion system protein M [Gammaproteobacteria bacterium]